MDAQTETEPIDVPPTTLPSSTTTLPTSIYSSLHAYPFETDTAFLGGLSQIFGHPGVPVTEAELAQKPDLALSAKCFYFSRKFSTPTPINAAGYKAWLASSLHNNTEASTAQPTITQSQPPSAIAASTPNSNTTASSNAQPTQPPYPTSFAAIVDLITNNKPIPGIEEIPSTVLELGSSKQDRATRRRKPWEKDDNDNDNDNDTSTENAVGTSTVDTVQDTTPGLDGDEMDRNVGARRGGEGLLRLLRPDAVPDSGLIAKE